MTGFSASRIHEYLKKSTNYDPDERFMATHDLTSELEKVDGVLDPTLQDPIRDAIIRQLNDEIGDVQTVAVRCLSMIVLKFDKSKVIEICDKLGSFFIDPKNEKSLDVYSIGIKAIVSSVREQDGKEICTKLLVSLLKGLKQSKCIDLLVSIMDIIKEIIERFGTDLVDSHKDLMETVLPHLKHNEEAIRKKSSTVLGKLVCVLDDVLFTKIIEHVISQIKNQKNESLAENYVQTISIISQSAGVRVGKYLKEIIPALHSCCIIDKTETNNDEKEHDKSELWENCLQAFASITSSCPDEVTKYVPEIVNKCKHFISYDPNLVLNENNDMEAEGEDDWGDDDGWGDDGNDWGADETNAMEVETETGAKEEGWDGLLGNIQQNGDDNSWKARRAAARCLRSFIKAKSSILKEYYDDLGEVLRSRFGERDETVLIEIFKTTRALFRESIVAKEAEVKTDEPQLMMPKLVRQRSSAESLQTQVDGFIECFQTHLKGEMTATAKTALFEVMKELLIVLQGYGKHLEPLMTHILNTTEEKDPGLRSDALSLLHMVIRFHDKEQLKSHFPRIVSVTISAIDDSSFVKAVTEALYAISSLSEKLQEEEKLCQELFEKVSSKLKLKDVDHVVKEAAILTIGVLAANCGKHLGKSVLDAVKILSTRLKNEVTRKASLQAFKTIADSGDSKNLKSIIEDSIKEMVGFLRKQDQQLKHKTVDTLESFVQCSSGDISKDLYKLIIEESLTHINDRDLQLSHLVLELFSKIIDGRGSLGGNQKEVLSSCLSFVTSPLLQGAAQASLIKLFSNMVQKKIETFESLMSDLLSCVTKEISKQSYLVIAQCIATMSKKATDKQIATTVDKFSTLIFNQDEIKSRIALLVVGEMGKDRDLQQYKKLHETVFSAFESKYDEVKYAASYALGNIAIGNMKNYLPIIVQLIKKHPDKAYLLLTSLNEIISAYAYSTRSKMQEFLPHVKIVTPIIFSSAEHKSEGVRHVAGECMGKIAVIDTEFLLPQMLKLVDGKAEVRGVVISAVKYAIHKNADLAKVKKSLATFFTLLKDKDLFVKRQAFLTINAIGHQNCALMNEVDQKMVIPILYDNTVVDQSLIEIHDLGAFKRIIDNGLPCRKAAYQCLETLLENGSERFSLPNFIKTIKKGFKDDQDIQILTYQIFYQLSKHHGPAVLEVLDGMVTILKKSITPLLKKVRGKDQDPRAVDVLRASIRSLDQMMKIKDVELCKGFCDFFKRVCATKFLQKLYKEMLENKA